MSDEALLLQIAARLQIIPFEVLNGCQKVFMSIWGLEAEVNNGGFSQYFSNEPGRYAHETRDNLCLIGAKDCAKLLDQAIKSVDLPEENWSIDDNRRNHICDSGQVFEDELDRLDNLFFQYPDDLSELMTRYVKNHAAELNL